MSITIIRLLEQALSAEDRVRLATRQPRVLGQYAVRARGGHTQGDPDPGNRI